MNNQPRQFQALDAERQALKARVGLTGATNAGKTWTALEIAAGLAIAEGLILTDGSPDWSKIGFIDTERKRALFYANNGNFGKFKHVNFEPPYHPNDYIAAVQYLESLGCKIAIIDSLTHAWSGTGGLLEIVAERTTASKSKNSYNEGWGGKDGGTALQNRMIDAIMSSNMHIIATFRQKQEYVQETDPATGKTTIRLVGVKPVQRDDLEYEFDITLKLDRDHSAEIIKNTVKFLNAEKDSKLPPLTREFGIQLGNYLSKGVDASEIEEERRIEFIKEIQNLGNQYPALITFFKTNYPNRKTNDLTIFEAREVLKQFKEML